MGNKKYKNFLIFKILSFVFLVVTIVGIMFTIKGFGDFESNKFMIGGLMMCMGLFLTFTCAGIGFSAEIMKTSVKITKHMQEATKEDMKDIANTNAEIHADAMKSMASAAKAGLEENAKEKRQTKFCKYCGVVIDKDSRFCKDCGKEQ